MENFGCRATQADGAAIERQFRERGLERAREPGDAGIVVLNTCTVTAAADQDARAAIRRIRRKNPGAQIVVTGCYAQRAPEEIAALAGVSSVIGNSHKHQLVEIALGGRQTSDLGPRTNYSGFVPLTQIAPDVRGPRPEARSPIFVSDIFAHTELQAAPVFDASNERTRPNLKVQEGCDNRCSFCVIPYVRGQSRSLPLPEVIREVESLVGCGYREVVISGINLGRWGRDLPGSATQVGKSEKIPGENGQRPKTNDHRPTFEDLIRDILSETGLQKLRISSVEPMDWSDELIELVASSPRIAKHAHAPLQSGSDTVLRRMHRKYRPWHYREKIEKIRAAMPTAAIGADVMAGFPGETEAEFEETIRLIEDLPLTYLHVFTYSARPGTPAANMSAQIPIHAARERTRILRDLASQKKLAFMRESVGRVLETITFNTAVNQGVTKAANEAADNHPKEFTEGLTDNYLPVKVLGSHQPNRWIPVRIESASEEALVGMAA